MKTKITLVAGFAMALIMLAFQNSNAQATNEPAVKVVPAGGAIKVIYAQGGEQAVLVKFLDQDNIALTDRIDSKNFDKGFIKRYDIKSVKGDTFWVEVSTRDFSALYKLTRDSKKSTWQSTLESATYTYNLLASK